jgi:alpha-tubulin suppressor-like RCC1 family protein
MRVRTIPALLFLAAGLARGEGLPPPETYNLILEGRLPEAARLNVTVQASKSGAGKLKFPLTGEKLRAGIHVPPGQVVELYLTAEDSMGERRYEGKANVIVKEGAVQSQFLELESTRGDGPVELTLATHRLQLDSEDIGTENQLFARVTARLFDASGAPVPIRPDDVNWDINDPWIRETMMPCKGGNGPPPPCIEFGPIKRGYLDPTALVCFQGTICRPNLDPLVWKKISVGMGDHACAIKVNGDAYCWGQGRQGQLGVAVPVACAESFAEPSPHTTPWECAPTPVQVRCPGGPCDFVDISAGFEHTCAVDRLMRAWCWGGNFFGQIGNGTDEDDNIGDPQPQLVLGNLQFTAISAGFDFTCGLTRLNQVFCWGDNNAGIVPSTTDTILRQPTRVVLGTSALALDAGWMHVCALAPAGSLFCWGSNADHALGSNPDNTIPQCGNCPSAPRLMQFADIPELEDQDVDLFSAGIGGSCAHVVAGGTFCWGKRVPAAATRGPIQVLTRGSEHYCFIENGTTRCAGLGKMGALGDGIFESADFSRRGPVVPLAPPRAFSDISAGDTFTCGISKPTLYSSDKLYCWGKNHLGSLGNGQPEVMSSVPVQVRIN